MHLKNSSAPVDPSMKPDEVAATCLDILKMAGDCAAAAPIGSERGTKGSGQRR